MTFSRQHQDLHVAFNQDREGHITKADLIQGEENDTVERMGPEQLQLNPAQLYALVDDVAVADPETWDKRFPQEEAAELALRRVADYLKGRAEANYRVGNPRGTAMGDAFFAATTRVMEEIEALYPDRPESPAEAIQQYHERS